MPVTATTQLPDEDQPSLGNGVEDEVAVDRESAVSNYGDVRIQIRETGASSWDSNAAGFGEFIGAYDTLTMEFVGLEDGEEYEVRARTETEHVTGSWTSPVSITTQFPGATNLTVVSTTSTSVELSWQDNADNEDGQLVIRERRGKDGSWWPAETITDAGPNTESAIDDSATPGNEYRYRIRPYTEHAEADSNLVTATTSALTDVNTRRIPPNGPYVEVEADDGTLRKPAPLEINSNPTLNGFPRIEIAVPHDETWQDDRWDEATLRVWRDGERLPIDQLERPEMTPSKTILHGIGGSELDTYVEREFSFTTAHAAADTLLSEETSIPYEIDDPGGQTDAVEQEYQAGSDPDTPPYPFDDHLLNDATEPVHVADDGAVELSRTTYTVEGEVPATSSNTVTSGDYGDDPDLSQNAAAHVTFTDLSTEITVDHEIPSENVAVQLRLHRVDATGELRVKIDGQVVGALLASTGGSNDAPQWFGDIVGDAGFTIGSAGSYDDPDAPPTLEPGTHTLEIEVRDYTTASETISASGDWNVDVIALYDDRWSPSLPSSTDPDDVLRPENVYPPSVTARFARSEPFGAVDGAGLSTTWTNSDVSSNQALALSNDRGDTWTEAANTNSMDVAFSALGPSIEFRATISAIADADGNARAATQALEAATVTVDTVGSPLIEGKTYQDSAMGILKSMASMGDVLFEVQVLDSGEIGFVMAYPGQRTAAVSPDLIDYTVSKKPMERVNGLRIIGRSQTVTGEPFTATTDGTNLVHEAIKEGSETVRDPNTGDVLERGPDADYTMTYATGTIYAEVGGAMTDGETYEISYSWQPSALIGRPDPDEGIIRTRSRAIPELYTEQECEEAAHFLLRQLSEMPWEASVTISDSAGWQLIAAVDPDQLPGSGPYRVRSIDESPERATLELGRGSTVNEAVEQLRGRLSSTEREV